MTPGQFQGCFVAAGHQEHGSPEIVAVPRVTVHDEFQRIVANLLCLVTLVRPGLAVVERTAEVDLHVG